jgi:hypothetical protein
MTLPPMATLQAQASCLVTAPTGTPACRTASGGRGYRASSPARCALCAAKHKSHGVGPNHGPTCRALVGVLIHAKR